MINSFKLNTSLKKYFLFFCFFIIHKNFFSQNDTLSKDYLNYKLLISSYYGITDSILYWLNKGADVNAISSDGISAINYAIQSKNINAVKALVLNGADINNYNYYSLPPIFLAVAYNQQSMVEFLLSKNAKTNITIKKNVSLLHYATKFADTNIIKLLIDNDYKLLFLKDEDGNTPLMTAIYFNRADVVQLLCRYSNLVSIPDNLGLTPLLLSVMKGNIVYAEQLINCGANIKEKSYNGYGIVEYAIISKNKDMLDWCLRNYTVEKNNTSAIKLAYVLGERKLAKELNKNRSNIFYGFVFQKLNVGLSNIFTSNDYLLGIKSQILEFNYGMHFSISYHTRLWFNRVLFPTKEENVYNQLWERRSLLGAQLYKHIRLYKNNHYTSYLLIGTSYYYTFGTYRGTNFKPQSYSITTPVVSILFQSKLFAFSISTEYFKFKNLNANGLHFKICQFFTIPFYRIYIPKKKITW